MIWYYIVTTIISTSALIISIINSVKNKKLNLRTKYYDIIFKDAVLMELPDCYQNYVSISTKSVNKEYSENFEKFIGNFRNKIRFLEFSNNKFYKKLDSILVDIDTDVVLLYSREEHFDKYNNKLYNDIKRLYTQIDKYYL